MCVCPLFSKRDIEVNFELHELHCYKNVTLCKKCNEPVAKSEMEEHMETHALVQCKCEEMIEKSQLEKHEVITYEDFIFT